MFMTKQIFKKWKSYKGVDVSVVGSGSRLRVYGGQHSTLQKNKAATEIQRHVRGYNVRKHLDKHVRFKLMNILLSPATNRKKVAEDILKLEGLDEKEAHKTVEDLDEAVRNKESIITKEEALCLLPTVIFNNNFAIHGFLQSTKCMTDDISKVKTTKASYIHIDPEVRNVNIPVIPIYVTQSTVYEIMNFYSDLGPEKDLELIVREKIRIDEKKMPVSSNHVIKERTIDKIGQQSNHLVPISAKYNSGEKQFLKNSINVQNSKKFFQSKINPNGQNYKGKVKTKWPEVQPHYTPKGLKCNIADGVIEQLNNLRKMEEIVDQVWYFL